MAGQQLRFEQSFGIIPGIVLSSIIYSLYHVGYGMVWSEMITLFIIGLVYSSVFRLTGNIFILFPFLTPMGAVFTNIKDNLQLPFEATYGFVLVIVLVAAELVVIHRFHVKNAEMKTTTGMNQV